MKQDGGGAVIPVTERTFMCSKNTVRSDDELKMHDDKTESVAAERRSTLTLFVR